MLSIAQTKTNFDNVQSAALSAAQTNPGFGGGADKSIAFANVSAVWALLYIERSRFAKQGFTPSAAAVAYCENAEWLLGEAWAKINGPQTGWEIAVAVAYANIASNSAYLFTEQVRVDNTTP